MKQCPNCDGEYQNFSPQTTFSGKPHVKKEPIYDIDLATILSFELIRLDLKPYITAASDTQNKYRCLCHGFYSA